MKGLELNIKICTIAAFCIGLVMAILNIYESWSQHAGTVHDPMLYLTLFLIAIAFTMSSFEHQNKYRELIVIGNFSIRVEHLLRITAYLFGGVITFSVNSESNIVKILHLIFTGSAIGVGYLLIVTYPNKKKGYLWAIIGCVFGIIGFLGGFVFNFYSVAWGEVLAALPLAIWIYKTLDQWK